MSKQEFLDSLRRSLSGNLDYNAVEEHIRYYSNYIENCLRQGDSEEEVMLRLGEPRLIAKTILGIDNTYTTRQEYVEEEPRQEKREKKVHYYQFNGKRLAVPAWLSTIAVSVTIVLVLGIFFAVFAGLLRFAFPIIMCVLLFRMLSKFFH